MSHSTEGRGAEQGGQAGPDLLTAALEYHRRGWSIIPIAAGAKTPPKNIRWKPYQKKRPTDEELRLWFADRDDLGLAVIVGVVSGGLVCRDFDLTDAYEAWAKAHPDLAETLPTVVTARGMHVYFRAQEADLRFMDLGNGEYRGDSGHLCVLPPSRHPKGKIYSWLIPLPEGPLPLIPDVLAAGLLPEMPDVTESTESTETTEITEDTDDTEDTEAVVWGASSANGRVVSSPSSLPPPPSDGAVDSVLSVTGTDIAKAINDTLPTGIGRRNKQVFQLARALKAIPRLADAQVEPLKPIVRRWHNVAVERKLIATEPFEETWIDFLLAWPKVKFPKGQEPMVEILNRARKAPLPKTAMKYEGPGLQLLTAICRELQRESGDSPFYLACRTASRLLTTDANNVDHVKASRWLRLLVHNGDLLEVEKGDRAKGRASRYRYLGA